MAHRPLSAAIVAMLILGMALAGLSAAPVTVAEEASHLQCTASPPFISTKTDDPYPDLQTVTFTITNSKVIPTSGAFAFTIDGVRFPAPAGVEILDATAHPGWNVELTPTLANFTTTATGIFPNGGSDTFTLTLDASGAGTNVVWTPDARYIGGSFDQTCASDPSQAGDPDAPTVSFSAAPGTAPSTYWVNWTGGSDGSGSGFLGVYIYASGTSFDDVRDADKVNAAPIPSHTGTLLISGDKDACFAVTAVDVVRNENVFVTASCVTKGTFQEEADAAKDEVIRIITENVTEIEKTVTQARENITRILWENNTVLRDLANHTRDDAIKAIWENNTELQGLVNTTRDEAFRIATENVTAAGKLVNDTRDNVTKAAWENNTKLQTLINETRDEVIRIITENVTEIEKTVTQARENITRILWENNTVLRDLANQTRDDAIEAIWENNTKLQGFVNTTRDEAFRIATENVTAAGKLVNDTRDNVTKAAWENNTKLQTLINETRDEALRIITENVTSIPDTIQKARENITRIVWENNTILRDLANQTRDDAIKAIWENNTKLQGLGNTTRDEALRIATENLTAAQELVEQTLENLTKSIWENNTKLQTLINETRDEALRIITENVTEIEKTVTQARENITRILWENNTVLRDLANQTRDDAIKAIWENNTKLQGLVNTTRDEALRIATENVTAAGKLVNDTRDNVTKAASENNTKLQTLINETRDEVIRTITENFSADCNQTSGSCTASTRYDNVTASGAASEEGGTLNVTVTVSDDASNNEFGGEGPVGEHKIHLCASDDVATTKGCLDDSDDDGQVLLFEVLGCTDPTDPDSSSPKTDPQECFFVQRLQGAAAFAQAVLNDLVPGGVPTLLPLSSPGLMKVLGFLPLIEWNGGPTSLMNSMPDDASGTTRHLGG